MKTQFAETIVAAVRGDRAVLRERCRAAPGRMLAAVNRLIGLMALAVLAATALAPGSAYAACGSSNRIASSSANCLNASWDNGTHLWTHSSASARNVCSDLGTVVAKVDIRGATDWTWHLTNDTTRQGTSDHNFRGVYCCSDLSDLCSISDIVNATSCTTQFDSSPASDTCNNVSMSRSTKNCVVTADCLEATGSTDRNSSALEVYYHHTDDVQNCHGDLMKGTSTCYSCGDHECGAADCDDAFSESPVGSAEPGSNASYCLDSDGTCDDCITASYSEDQSYSSSYDSETEQCTITALCWTRTWYGTGGSEVLSSETFSATLANVENATQCGGNSSGIVTSCD